MTAPAKPPPQPLVARRIIGVDLARFAAIMGMMAAHLYAIFSSDRGHDVDRAIASTVDATVSSTAATSFAVLGGVSLVLLSRSMRDRHPARVLLSILIRGALISLIGFALDLLPGFIAVVLTAYGVSMIIAALALFMPSRVIAALAIFLWLFGAALNAQVRAAPPTPTHGIHAMLDGLGELLLTGHYPAITWVAYMLVGILIARALLGAPSIDALRSLCLHLAGWGLAIYAAITVAGRIIGADLTALGLPPFEDIILHSGGGAPITSDLWMLFFPTPHSGSPADMLRTVAGACFLIGLLVLLVDARRSEPSPATAAIIDVVRAAGAAPLTIYTAHVLVTAGLTAQLQTPGPLPFWLTNGTPTFIAQLLCMLVVGFALSMLHVRGPLEALLARLSGSGSGGPARPRTHTHERQPEREREETGTDAQPTTEP